MESPQASEQSIVSEIVNQRLGLDGLDYPVPVRAGQLDFMLGALTLVALVLLALTGVVLTQFFNPAVNGAHDSVRYILTGSAVVALLRDVHIWSASASLTLVFSHLVAVFWRGGFRRPREGMWWSGVLLLAVLFGLAFTGTVLPGDQGAVEALSHATAAAKLVGPLGAVLTEGFTPSSPLATRLYGMHVSVLPLALVAVLALHLWLIRQLSVSADGETQESFRRHLRRVGGFGFLLVSVVTTLALVFPRDLLQPGIDGVELTKPLWPFLWIYAAENLFGLTGMMLAPGVLFGFLALVPVADRRDGRGAQVVRVVGVVLFALMVTGILYAALAPAQPHLNMAM